MSSTLRNLIFISIIVISSLMHFKHFTKELVSFHVWRQTQTQSTINSFYEEDMNILNPRRNERGNTEGIFRMEFPMMQWLVASQYKLFGNHLIISRIFMFVIGLLSVYGIYKLLQALFKRTLLAVIGAWAFNFSPSFYYYTINPLPDNFALCFSIWGLALFFMWSNHKKTSHLILSSLCLSIGALCKLPFIIYYVVPFGYFGMTIIKHQFNKQTFNNSLLAFSCLLLPVSWYAYVIPGWHGNVIVKGMLENKDSGSILFDYLQHNLISTLPELLLNYGSVLFFLLGFYFLYKKQAYKNAKFIPLLLLSAFALMYYFFEANAIAKVHDYYLFPFYPLLFVLVAYGAYHLCQSPNKWHKLLTVTLLLLLPITCYFRMKDRWDLNSPGFNVNLLSYKADLRNAVPNNALVVAGNDVSHFIFLYYINKKGWGFDSDNLTPEILKSTIENGAKYIYTDSEVILNNPKITCFFDELVMERGNVRVYKLKNNKLQLPL